MHKYQTLSNNAGKYLSSNCTYYMGKTRILKYNLPQRKTCLHADREFNSKIRQGKLQRKNRFRKTKYII